MDKGTTVEITMTASLFGHKKTGSGSVRTLGIRFWPG